MSATAAFLHQPTFAFFPCYSPKFNNDNFRLKPNFCFHSRGTTFVFSGGFISRGSKLRGSTAMTDLIRTSAFRDSGKSDEGIQVLEQEAFIDGSTEFRRELLSGGFESTLNRLSKWLVASLFGMVLLWRHDPEALWAAMGSVLNAMLSILLKRILNQERPVSTNRSDPGMPSSHAQSIFYTVSFAVLSVLEWLGVNELSLAIGGLALTFGSYLSWLRVSQGLHTISQVVVGATAGSIFSILWYLSWKSIVLEAFASSLWVQIIVVLGAAGFCVGFLLYVILYWFRDE